MVKKNMKFKVLVINLDSSHERLESIKKQCISLGLKFERIPGVIGGELAQDEKLKVYNENVNKKFYYKKLNNGEIGCYLSHAACWNKIVSEELDYALVLEDDAIMDDNLPDFISAVGKLNKNWDYIQLSHGSKKKNIYHSKAIGKNIYLGECVKLPSTNTGQFISLSGAKKLLETAFPISRPVDTDIQYWFEKNLRCLVVRPFPIHTAGFKSDIDQVAERRKSKKNRLYRLWLKLCYELSLLKHRRMALSIMKSLNK